MPDPDKPDKKIRRPGRSASASSGRGKRIQGASEGASRRELIDTGTDKRLVRRDEQGRFKESDDLGRSLAADRRQKAKGKKPKNQGDRGD